MAEEELSNYEKEEQKKKRQEMINYRNKKKFSSLFLVVGCIFEIIETLIISFILLIAFTAIVSRIFTGDALGTALSFAIILALICGFILGFFVYKKAIVFIIKKKHLEDRLSDDILNHYVRDPNEEKAKKQRR